MDILSSPILSSLIVGVLAIVSNFILFYKNKNLQDKIFEISEENKFKLSSIDSNIKRELIYFTETNKFKLAAIDERLKVAQDAYKLWRKMFDKLDSNDKFSIIKECNEWWDSNCLYLTEEVRENFIVAINNFRNYESYKQMRNSEDENFDKVLVEKFKQIKKLGPMIEESVNLKSISIEHNDK